MAISGMLIGKNYVTLMMNDTTKTIIASHPNYAKIREAVRVKDFDLVEKLVNVAKSVTNYMAGKITINEGQVFYGNEQLHGAIVDRILDMMNEGFDHEPMVRFLENLMSNPSKRAVDELYSFLEVTCLPITEDGHFLAYKRVREDYKDFYTGQIDNSIGSKPKMRRNEVDDNRDNTCSKGLHFCSMAYLPHYHGNSGRIMIVKINPADVVSIPSDYNNAKGRACTYEIVGEHTSENTEAFNKPVWNDKHWTDEEDSWEEEEEEEGWEDTISPPICPPHSQVSVRNGALVGYNQGRKDASSGIRYNDSPSAHAIVVSDIDAYRTAYSKGWNSIKLGK